MGDDTYGRSRRGEDERGRRGPRGGYEDEAYRQASRERDYYGGGVDTRFDRGEDRGRFGHDEDVERQGWRRGGEGRGGGWQRGGFGGAYGGSDRGAEEQGRRGGWSGEGRDFGRGGGGSMSGRFRDDEFGGEIDWGRDEGRGGGGQRWGRGGGESAGGAGHRGKGPRGYRRSDDRIREDISDRLSDDDEVDASDIEVRVENGEVTLTGEVDSKYAKRRAEDIAEAVSGVSDVQNDIRLRREQAARQEPGGQQSGGDPSRR